MNKNYITNKYKWITVLKLYYNDINVIDYYLLLRYECQYI